MIAASLSPVAWPARSDAVFHLAVIDEVLASSAGDGTQQFVEIRMLAASQNVVANSVLAAFAADGAYIDDLLVMPGNVPLGDTGGTWTMVTQPFQDAHGFVADFTMSAGIPSGGGMVCWGAPGVVPPSNPSSWDHANPASYVDRLAYGTYSGPRNVHSGEPTTLDADGHSLVRVGETDDNRRDFACADAATPRSNSGASVTVPATMPCSAGSHQSGLQVTPDGKRTLVSKDVGGARWAITRNADDSTVTGNVFSPEGGGPLFVFCEQTSAQEGTLTFD